MLILQSWHNFNLQCGLKSERTLNNLLIHKDTISNFTLDQVIQNFSIFVCLIHQCFKIFVSVKKCIQPIYLFKKWYTSHKKDLLQVSIANIYSLVVKNPPAMWETWVQSLGWEDPLGEGMATHSRILAWRVPMDRGAWWGHKESDMTEQLSTYPLYRLDVFFFQISLL